MILHSGLSFFLASSPLPITNAPSVGHSLNPFIQYIVFPLLGATALLLLQRLGKMAGTKVDEKTLESKSSKEILQDLSRKLLPTTTKDSFGTHTTNGWIADMEERMAKGDARMDDIEENQRRYMSAQGVPTVQEEEGHTHAG